MLPFDNKSEFQVVVDMPAGTPVEHTAAVLHEMGAYLAHGARGDRLSGLRRALRRRSISTGSVRQYYLRSGGEVGDLQVNLVDKHERDEQSHEIAHARAPRAGADRRAASAPT